MGKLSSLHRLLRIVRTLQMESKSVWRGLFYGGFSSCVAETVTMPVDVVKTRLQMDGAGGVKVYNGTMDCASKMVKADGPGALFKGLPPALVRQSTYGSLRYGMYGPIRNSLGVKPGTPAKDIPLWKKIVAGAAAGAISSAVANPTDLMKVRLQTDGTMKGPDGNLLPKRYTGMSFQSRATQPVPSDHSLSVSDYRHGSRVHDDREGGGCFGPMEGRRSHVRPCHSLGCC